MKHKLSEMMVEELRNYISKYLKAQSKLQDGSKNWLKAQRRIHRAEKRLV